MIAYPLVKRIEHWALDKLIPFARNPRTHSDAQVAQIAASIAAFGFNNPSWLTRKPVSSRGTAVCWPPESCSCRRSQ